MDGRMIDLFVMLLLSMCRAAPVSESFTVLVGSPVSVQRGATATLPCWLSPSQSAENLEVRWYRGNYDTPIISYKGKMFDDGSQEPSYAGRVSFDLKEATSGGLKAGDVSLKLVNVTVKDEGDYTCYVSSLHGYDSSTMSLRVMETGGPPLLSAVWKEENTANVSCESEGWYPRPDLRWSDKTKDLKPVGLVYSNVSGHFSVHSWLLVSGSSEVSCSVGLSNIVTKEARIRTIKPPDKGVPVGWVAFGIVLIILLVGLAAFFYKMKGKKSAEPTEENVALLPEEVVQPSALETASKHYENIKLENTNNKYLKVKDTILRDAPVETFPDGQSVTCLTAIRGTPGFSGGKHYWEVSLGNENIEPKKSWWIGVTTATEIPQESDFCPNTSNGFWFLSSSPNTANTLQFSTKPEIFLSVQSRPRTVGVYLDCDSGELSFYHVEDKNLILSLKDKFTKDVFPLFNPGKGDVATITILHRTSESGEEHDVVDSVMNNAPESTASDPAGKQTSSESADAADS
ncbi:butyrophilin subfamily 2 member A2-like isoform X3 [Melanotaenia boesemani]|uniref:butyrophilin subfamily 2 member A2-like isoform X3 n=1 Tax=Melanotaenia boesemani TaxID=1250792 RepID=UPI001C0499D3|nr:butyrophilin subfamily 2 member A2-like isoform X3 [Melanotaenia boesemani]